ncbi:septum site determining protein [Nocardioides sp. BP30]|uniref:septum site-determining protein Ssd n=1 Tax=Nocardioides sp. BP30 TaxID=3036374 RepID=UPI002468E05F|nr:septum site-determining protein Ssd [Nocardioides sp. BP30]WGL52821.1 septum site determining protein [Nocardioides sp. BP30]
MTALLLITADDLLLDELLRLAAAAGVTPEVARDLSTALRAWSRAPAVVVGADLLAGLARMGPPRRPAVHVAGWGAAGEDVFRSALAVGAEHVVELPDGASWLTALLTDLGDDPGGRGLLLGVVSGSGGAGGTTFACALGQAAAESGPAVVIDADPLGPGIDRVLGLEEKAGVRWPDLAHTAGRLGSRSLREALPRRGALGALSWARGAPGAPALPDAVAVREVLSAAARGHQTVVLDLPRGPGSVELVGRCDEVLVVVTPTITGIASAARLVDSLVDRGGGPGADPGHLGLVVRGGRVGPEAVARAVGLPVRAAMADQRGLAEAIDLGLGPLRARRGPLARAAAEVLGRLKVRAVAA